MKDLTSYLFETKAMKICPENEPFWYTSGKIGPYYINTQFLYGNEEKSKNLLKFIDEEKDNKITLPKKVHDKVLENYNNDEIYKIIEEEIDKNLLFMALDKLSYREKQIMELRFGLSTKGKEKTQKEVANILGISQSYISRLEKKIIFRLKKEMKKFV